mmetsp:Transcript_63195/g.53554  ORF Transcript_63195/g.53554 Transcript_63195/m.53554 type:complete len:101 (+) Transcript_63195:527-829(+)
MHNMNVKTTRALCLILDDNETVQRPWYKSKDSQQNDIMQNNPVAISTRVCQSFVRIGQIELYGNRTKVNKDKINELKLIVEHLLNTDYKDIKGISFEDKI